MLLDKVTILRVDLNGPEREGVAVEVDVIALSGLLALHRSLAKVETGDYTISHIPTGLMIGTCISEAAGRDALNILTSNGIEWAVISMDSPEAKAAGRKLSEVYTRLARDYIHIEGLKHPLQDFAERERPA